MKLTFRALTSLEEALQLAPLLDQCAAEALDEFRDDPLPDEVTARFLCTHFDDPHCLLLVCTTEEGSVAGACLTGPFADPLTGERVPMILLLYVDSEVRHRGVGRELVREASSRLLDAGASAIGARAGHNDDARISMGERWGFLRQWEFMLLEP